jgi:pimeloyl-ACP methyl ester carboxylesterase
MLAQVVQTHSKRKKVTLLQHDWGCSYGYQLSATNPEMVKRIVALDIGGGIQPYLSELLCIIAYQFFLVFLFLLGYPMGDWVQRTLVPYMFEIKHRDGSEMSSKMCYPYYHFLFGEGPKGF